MIGEACAGNCNLGRGSYRPKSGLDPAVLNASLIPKSTGLPLQKRRLRMATQERITYYLLEMDVTDTSKHREGKEWTLPMV